MPPGIDNLVGPGVVGFVIAFGYVAKLALDWWDKRGERRAAKRAAGDGEHLPPEAVANGPEWLVEQLRGSLTDEREEVARLSGRVQELETQNALLYEQIRKQRRDYEREVAELRQQLADVSQWLEAFQVRLRLDPPPVTGD